MTTQTAIQTVQVSKDKAGIYSAIRSVMTEEQQTEAIALVEVATQLQWRAGDLVNDIYRQCIANRLEVTQTDVCTMVSDDMHGEFSPATLKVYSAIARFYPINVRQQYGDVMPYGVFRFAATFGDDYARVFKWAELFMTTYGRPPYGRELKAQFKPTTTLLQQLQGPPPPEAFITPITDADREAELIERNIPEYTEQVSIIDPLPSLLQSFINIASARLHKEQSPERKMLLAQLLVLCKRLLTE
jgi:hypothetical protein